MIQQLPTNKAHTGFFSPDKTADASLTAKVFSGINGLRQLYEPWRTSIKQHGSNFVHHPNWYEAQLAGLKKPHCVFFIALYSHSQLHTVIPLQRRRIKKYGCTLSFVELFYSNEMGICDIYSLADHNDNIWELVIHSIQRTYPNSYFLRLQHTPLRSHFEKLNIPHKIDFKKISHNSKYLDVDTPSPTIFWEQYSKNFKRNLRRLRKKALTQGSLQFKTYQQASDLNNAFQELLQVEHTGWKGKNGTSIFSQKKKREHYETLLRGYADTGHLQINTLYLNDQPIASQFCVNMKGTLYLLKIGYNENYSEFSPGQLLLEDLLNSVIEDSAIKRVSFVTGTTWMERWKPLYEPVFLSYKPTGKWQGNLIILLLILREKIKSKISLKGTSKNSPTLI
ncbi:GNAT family N-acetyltransferase [Marinibactrum halimedae]|uniref:BioF2-like acetyltransferase domain-containing protein n=1 Tax=Marinibactrum halimedae TaxID=1444977 RepID=A0AA37T6H5_9GAMM|nr:GNAT family N-acetyltransferase [Marinibactrum halimedae]MCD9460249.1 GNAT family N-acetyltransferase [Marinibactrum halimedae]GLS27915.1 hypothetical protein GCM10007877_36340 [Marinibactrum halimedae]